MKSTLVILATIICSIFGTPVEAQNLLEVNRTCLTKAINAFSNHQCEEDSPRIRCVSQKLSIAGIVYSQCNGGFRDTQGCVSGSRGFKNRQPFRKMVRGLNRCQPSDNFPVNPPRTSPPVPAVYPNHFH